jgi:hypothetical protein
MKTPDYEGSNRNGRLRRQVTNHPRRAHGNSMSSNDRVNIT